MELVNKRLENNNSLLSLLGHFSQFKKKRNKKKQKRKGGKKTPPNAMQNNLALNISQFFSSKLVALKARLHDSKNRSDRSGLVKKLVWT